MNNPTVSVFFGLLGGLGFFLFGMKLFAEGLRGVAGERLKKILVFFTRTPLIGLAAGAGLTALVQSSSAISVLLVGFVNASLLTLHQAIGVIFGMNIGTTITAWFVSAIAVFRITAYALPAVGIGFALHSFGRSRAVRQWGQVVLGFGMLFTGLGIMGDVFEPLRESERAIAVFAAFSRYPLLGLLAGALATMLLQSSSAAIMLVQLLALNGVISFPAAIFLVLGDNIGTTATAMVASTGTTVAARRVARVHLLFNLAGVAWLFYFAANGTYARFIEFLVPGTLEPRNIMVHIALAHTLFNVANAFLALPFIPLFEKAAVGMVRDCPDEVCPAPRFLEEHLLDTPVVAFEQVTREILRMLGIARGALADAYRGLAANDRRPLAAVAAQEEAVDNLQREITRYLIALSRRNLDDNQAQEIPVLIHSVNDIERIGDHAENIVELAERRIDQQLVFSAAAAAELETMYRVLLAMLDEVATALGSGDRDAARRALKHEEKLNRMQLEFRQTHVERLDAGSCRLISGLVFLDAVDNFEKIGDHLTNIAQAVIGGLRWENR